MPVITKCVRIVLLITISSMPASLLCAQAREQIVADAREQQAAAIMQSFARRSGLTTGQPPRRYLWTDAFAVCNYLGLAHVTGDPDYHELALMLVDQVHQTLGRHRADDTRSGWISGLSEEAGALHPTRGGLRIGKTLPERGPNDEFDERLEWDRDGQYFHYLTKWMHALDQVTRTTGFARFNIWARELAATAYDAFRLPPPSNQQPPRMVWKKSIDLSRALVPSMGKHDPLDGYITSLQLTATAAALPQRALGPTLEYETAGFAHMVSMGEWTTEDPLGIGGLLVDAYRLLQLQQQRMHPQHELVETLLDAAIAGLNDFVRSGELQQPLQYRLAFRELGLAIGLHALEHMAQLTNETNALQNHGYPRLQAQLARLMPFIELREDIEKFWLDPGHQQTEIWAEHRNINEVMLATSLVPDGYLQLSLAGRRQSMVSE